MNARALKTFTAVGAAGAALAFSACGSDDSTSSSDTTAADTAATTESTTSAAETGSTGGGSDVKIAADPSAIAYTSTDVTASAGNDTITFDNPSTTPHNVTIEDADGNSVGATDTVSDDTATADVDLKPGTYTFYCSVSDHRAEGMEGTITVK